MSGGRMCRPRLRSLLFFALFVALVSGAFAQRQTGSIKGAIFEADGAPLPGATVSIKSDSMLGELNYVTSTTGDFRFPSVPPGSYNVTVDMPGFKKVTRENVKVLVGATVTVNFTLDVAAVEKEVMVTASSPTIDVVNPKVATVVDTEMLRNLPLARNLTTIVNTVPGAVDSTFHGSTVRGSTYALDGVNINDPVSMTPMTDANYDIIDEVEVATAALPAEVGYTTGAYINVVTLSGGNRFSGGAQVYYTNKHLASSLWTDDQLAAFGVAKPTFDKSSVDASVSLGGPIIKNKLWFFSNYRRAQSESTSAFIGPYTDFLGRTHTSWPYKNYATMGLAKLTYQVSPKMKVMGMFNYSNPHRPVDSSPGAYTTFISTRDFNETSLTGTGTVNYIFNQNAFAEFKLGIARVDSKWHLQEEALDLPIIFNRGTLYSQLGSSGSSNDEELRKRTTAGLSVTYFKDRFLGGSHEIKGGVEFEDAYGDWNIWQKENYSLYYNQNSPYYVDPVNKIGLIYFLAIPSEKGTPQVIDKARRIGAYLQDSWTIAKRLTVNLGLRFDRSWGWKPSVTRGAGSPLSVWVGENVVSPYCQTTYPTVFPDGINPFDTFTTETWNDVMTWNTFSPRFGLTYDPWGDGKTAVKAAFSRYSEYMMIDYFRIVSQLYPRTYGYYWQDMNSNGAPDSSDTWTELGYDYRFMSKDFLSEMLDPNTKSPLTDELTFGINREILKDFSVGGTFIYKNTKNIFEDAMYNVDNGNWMYHPDQAETQEWWVPFTTIIPGAGDYPDTTVTAYFRRLDSPGIWYRASNLSELTRKYRAYEFSFNKRMSDGWQLTGSVVLSKSWGNAGMNYYYSRGWTGIADKPNSFVNATGRLSYDRPLVIKLLGTAQLPWDFVLSAYYTHSSGAPLNRQCQLICPADWAAAHNVRRQYVVINVDAPGTYRWRASDIVDMRLEKEFPLGKFGKVGAYVDILNLLGYTDVSIGVNDVYRYAPLSENTLEEGAVTLDPTYKKISSVSGTRTFKFSLRYSF
ncbi:MAG: TonB-dependent receptor [Acidobacteriota bacterium]